MGTDRVIPPADREPAGTPDFREEAKALNPQLWDARGHLFETNVEAREKLLAAALRSAFARGRESAAPTDADEDAFLDGLEAISKLVDRAGGDPQGIKRTDFDRVVAAFRRSGAGDAEPEVIARLRWFAETGDLKAWSGPDGTVDSTREAMRADVAAILARPIAAAAPGVRVWTLWTAKDTLIDAFEYEEDAEASRAWHTAHESGAGPYRVIECRPLSPEVARVVEAARQMRDAWLTHAKIGDEQYVEKAEAELSAAVDALGAASADGKP